MEPVSTAILAALAAGLTRGGQDAVSSAVSDAYNGLKALLERRFGKNGRVTAAVSELEGQPASQARRAVLDEELASSGALDDPDVVAAARSLLDEIAKLPGGDAHVQQATGSYIAQADRGGTAQVRVNAPPDP